MLGVITGFAIILAVIFTGWFLAQKGVIGSDKERLMFNRVAFYAATPALIFSSVAKSDPQTILSPVTVAIVIATVVTAAVYCAIFWRKGIARMSTGAGSTSFFNSVNIGFPVSIYVIGEATWVVPIMLLQMAVLTPIVLAGISGKSPLGAMKTGLLSPVVVAGIAGLVVALAGIDVPAPVMEPIALLGGASIPMVLMSFGASLKSTRVLEDAQYRAEIWGATALKLVGMPLAGYLTALAMGMNEDLTYATVILCALPTAQNIYNYAATFQKGETIARDTVFITTFASLPVMMIIAFLFGR